MLRSSVTQHRVSHQLKEPAQSRSTANHNPALTCTNYTVFIIPTGDVSSNRDRNPEAVIVLDVKD